MRKVGLSKGLTVLFILLIFSGVILAQDWALPLNLVSGDGVDTMTVTLGVHYTATDMFDEGLDIAYPMAPPPPVRYAYFPIDDPAYPGIRMLGTDFRDPVSTHIWTIVLERDYTSEDRTVFWDPEDLPFPAEDLLLAEQMLIGAAFPGTEVGDEEWTDMSEVDHFNFPPGRWVFVKFVPLGAIDRHPPQVTSFHPADGAEGVRRVRPIEFDIQDDITGVDPASLVVTVDGVEVPHDDFTVMRSILNGYHIQYLPADDWPELATICVTIDAQDFADPPNVMETFESCFSTPAEPPDTFPPYFEDLSITPGDTINIWRNVFIKILDAERGVDGSSITVTINGMEYTNFELILFTEFLYDYNIKIMPPPTGWNPGEHYEVVIHGCDRATPANCADTTFTFIAGGTEPAPFEFPLQALSMLGADTTRNALTIAIHPDATDGYDRGLDIASPSPPFATYGYFPLNDPTYEYITQLSKDVRKAATSVTWQVKFNNPGDMVGLKWDREALVETLDTIGTIRIGYGPLDSLRWQDMRLYDHVSFGPASYCYIRFNTVLIDTIPPRIWGRNPGPGDVDVPLGTLIKFDILDPESGVDASSISLRFGRSGGSLTTVDPSDYELTPLPTGFRVSYRRPGVLDYNTTYVVRVSACDEAPSANCATFEWTFTTTTTCAPIFRNTLNVASGEEEMVSLSLGTATDALVGRDPHDVPIPVPPPSGFYAYFPIADDPIYTMLSTDIRPNCAGAQVWQVMHDRPVGPIAVTWNRAAIFADEEWELRIASAAIGSMPSHSDYEIIMNDVSEFTYTAGENAFIKLGNWDDTETYCVSGVVSLWGGDTETVVSVSVSPIGVEYDTPPGGGPFEICRLSDDMDYRIILSAEGYVPETVFVYIDGADYTIPETIELRPPGALVHGLVRVEGDPQGGVNITLGEDVAITRTNGTWRIENVLPDVTEICYSGFPVGYPDTCMAIDLDGIDSLYLLFDYVAPPLNVYGTVRLDGVLTEGVNLYWCGEATPVATTNADGEYIITDVGVGERCLEARYPGYDTESRYFFMSDHTEINFNLSPGLITISGTVTNDCGYEVTGLRVSTRGTSPVFLGPDGNFSFRDMDWGDYTITVSGQYHAEVETTITVDGDIVVNIVIPCLPCATGLRVDAADLTRPLSAGEELANTISWTPPTTDVDIASYVLYRNGREFATGIDASADSYEDVAVVSGTEYTYNIRVIYDVPAPNNHSPICGDESGIPVLNPDVNEILIIDYDGGATPIGGTATEVAMRNLLESPALGLDITGITTTAQNPPDLNGYNLADYDFVIVTLGVRDHDDGTLSAAVAGDLIAYANMDRPGGTALYIEGPDFGRDYRGGTGDLVTLFNLFGINYDTGRDGNPDTEGNVETISLSETIVGGFSPRGDYAYRTLADRFVDNFVVMTARPFVYCQDELVRATIHNDGPRKLRVASAIYTAAISDIAGGYPNMAARVMGEYLIRAGLANTAVEEIPTDILPVSFEISKVYPNPFNPATTIEFDVSENAFVTVAVYDVKGALVRTLAHGDMTPGKYKVGFDATGLPTGAYFVKLEVNGQSATSSIMFMK